MRNRLLFLFVMGVVGISYTTAQVATLDSQKILASMPQVQQADTLIKQEQQRLSQEYNKLRYTTQIQLGVADSLFQAQPKEATTTAAVEKAQQMNQELIEFEQTANKKLVDFQQVLMTPYYEKINAAIKKVAVRKKYTQVLDIQQVPLVYRDEKDDITQQVIEELKK